MYGDPHFLVPLFSNHLLCYSIQGYPGLAFNLIYNKNFIINAQFVDSVNDMKEATWIAKPKAEFDVSFCKNHLDINWNIQYDELPELHGLIG